MYKSNPGLMAVTTIRWKVSGALVALVIALSVAHFALSDDRAGNLVFLVAVSAAAAALYAGYYAYATLIDQSARAKRQASFEVLRHLDSVGFLRIGWRMNHELETNKVSPDELYKKITGDSDLFHDVVRTLCALEDAAIAVKAGHIDEEILYYGMHNSAVKLFEELSPYISKERERIPSFYVELNDLVQAWKSRQSLQAGVKFPDDKYPIR